MVDPLYFNINSNECPSTTNTSTTHIQCKVVIQYIIWFTCSALPWVCHPYACDICQFSSEIPKYLCHILALRDQAKQWNGTGKLHVIYVQKSKQQYHHHFNTAVHKTVFITFSIIKFLMQYLAITSCFVIVTLKLP